MIDKATKAELLAFIGKAIATAMDPYNERYLTGDELCKQFGMFSPSWLKTYGDKLPRTRLEVKANDGTIKCSRWGYPLHRIARMIETGEIKKL